MAPAQPELKKVRLPLPFSDEKAVDVGLLPHPLFHSKPSTARRLRAQMLLATLWTNANVACVQYLDKRLFVQLNGSRKVLGVLRGYDVFLNIVLDEAVEEKDGGEKVKLGMVVRLYGSPSRRLPRGSILTEFPRSSVETPL